MLKIYPVVLELVRRLAPVIRGLRLRSPSLADQMERALVSVPLNTAEGAYSRGKNRQARFQSAAASARETLACLETAEAMGFVGPVAPSLAHCFAKSSARWCASSSLVARRHIDARFHSARAPHPAPHPEPQPPEP
ncbi:MAG TPA: four helix bundle protein [Polyangiaceae bacterium]|nr:four helix bundle protein [Polyangiaceae bacterium]